MIIDATAEARACSITYAPPLLISKKPMVWAEVFGGGFGGHDCAV